MRLLNHKYLSFIVVVLLCTPQLVLSQTDSLERSTEVHDSLKVNEEEEFKGFLKLKTDSSWTSEQLYDVSSKCYNELKGKGDFSELCVAATRELSQHIIYTEFIELTEYQQGRLMGKILDYITGEEN